MICRAGRSEGRAQGAWGRYPLTSMGSNEDKDFLLRLVHRGLILRDVAERVFPELQKGADLDELLQHHTGLSAETIAKWRRTRAGELPEIPGYDILGHAGTGGTADVFRAREKKTGRVLALKVLNADSSRNAKVRDAFVKEAKLLEKLRHKGLVEGYGVFKSGSTFYSKMEFVEGSTLQELLDQGQPFEETVALKAVLGASEVLAYLCEQGIVHRDLKPGNIMLATSGTLKLIDLGFAGDVGSGSLTPSETTVGTKEYLPPESAQGINSCDVRSDIYSLGVTLFQLVVGRLPFQSTDDRELLRMHVMQSLKSPELKTRNFSHQLHYFIEKMMAKDMAARYQSWGELIGDIREQIEGRERYDLDNPVRSPRRR